MLHHGWYFENSNDFSGNENLKNAYLCPFMLQYGWRLDNSKKWKSIFQNWKVFLCTLLGYSMYTVFSPPARWGLLDFIRAVLPPPPPPPLRQLPSSVGTAGPQPPTSGLSGHRWTSIASCRSEWAPLDLNRQRPIWVGTAGPQPPASDLSGHRWTSTASRPISVGTAGPQRPNRMPKYMPKRLPEYMPDRMPEDMPDRMSEYMPDRMSEYMPDRMSEYMPDRMPEYMPDWMPQCMPDKTPEYMPDKMQDGMSEHMPDRMSEYPDRMQNICQIECQNICQIECQNICQIECQNVCEIECQNICQTKRQNICQIKHPNLCQIKCQIECQNICQIECMNICQIDCQNICHIECENICEKECHIECQNICQNMARQQKAAYVRPIKDSSVVAGRVSEQVCGRLVHHYTETFKKGTSKSVAVLVDDNALRSVLVLEAWSVADQTHMQNAADRLATSQTKKTQWLACKGSGWYLCDPHHDIVMVGITRSKVISILEDAPSRFFFNSMFYVRVLPYTWKECSLKFPKGSPHELPIFRQSLQWRMYHVPYSMSGFLQLIADGSPNKHQRKKKGKGRNRREYKRTPSRKHSVNNFWIRIVERNRFPDLTSFWLHFALKEMQFEVHKRLPPRAAKFQAIVALTNVWCSIFYVWVSAADSWWQPKQASKEKEKKG